MVANARATSVRSIELSVPDLDAARRFYEDGWGLAEVARVGKVSYLRGTGGEHHIVALHGGDEPGAVRVNVGVSSRADVDALYERLSRAGASVIAPPSAVDEPGEGYGFGFHDAEGREFRVTADVRAHADATYGADRPVKISHVVFNSGQTLAERELFTALLGFRLRDETRGMDFLGCNADHHSLAFTRFGGTRLNHIAFDLPNIDAVMRGAGRLKSLGYRMQWGLGRHGPGANVFAYFLDPHDLAIEYTCEMEQVDDTYRGKTPDEWAQRGSPDAWGVADPPTERFERATCAPVRT
jgi:catechol 2,3-dioxygenase-like lactoylglutathione lyase family enzyme